MMKNINSEHVALIKAEIGESAKYVESAEDSANTQWLRVHLPEENKDIKLVPKGETVDYQRLSKKLQRVSDMTSDDGFTDVVKFINDNYFIFKDLLPNYIKETDNYYCFEWLGDDWEVPTREDFLNTNTYSNKLNKIANNVLPSLTTNNGSKVITDFTKRVFTRFNKLYRDTANGPLPANTQNLYGPILEVSELNRLCISPSNITIYDFVVKRDVWGEVTDWKYVDIKNLSYTFPRYYMTVDEKTRYPCDNPGMQHAVNDDHIGHDILNNSELVKLYASDGFKTYISDGVEWHAGDILNDL